MVFATLAISTDDRIKSNLMHLLNDFRNINEKVYVLTNMDIDLDYYCFDNVFLVKTDKEWTDYSRFELIKYIFENTEETLVYFMDSDARLFDFREEKYDSKKFEDLIRSKDFDLIVPWGLGYTINIEWHLRTPEIDENKDVRNYTFGHERIISYLKNKLPNYNNEIKKQVYLESILLFKKSEKMMHYLNELIEFGNILKEEDEKINRRHKAISTSVGLSIFENFCNIKIIIDFSICHFFKPNYLTEVFLWKSNMQKSLKIYNE